MLEPARRRQGAERVAFVCFLLAAGLVHSMGLGNVGLASCLLATAYLWRARRRQGVVWPPPLPARPVRRALAVFVGLSAAACFFSTLPSRSIPEIKGLWSFLIFPLALLYLEDEGDADLVLDLWRAVAGYLMLRGMVEYLLGQNDLDHRLSGGMSVYMSYAGVLLGFVLTLLARAALGSGTRTARLVDLAVAVGGSIAIGLTLTRNAYLGLGVGLIVLALLARLPSLGARTPRTFYLLLPLLLGVAYLAVPAPVRSRALSSFDSQDETMRDRLLMWRAGGAMVADRPFFGVGPGRVKELYPVYRLPGFVDPHPGHLHNNVVHIAAETGPLSALAYLAFIGTFFVLGVRRARLATASRTSRAIAAGAVATMAALFVAGMFEYNFGDVEVLRLLLVVAALPFASSRSDADL